MADSFLFYNLSEAQMTFQDVMERLKAFVQKDPVLLMCYRSEPIHRFTATTQSLLPHCICIVQARELGAA